ncbi:PIG-L family deacetylase [Granulicella sp. WH15]|nr:PIG-L family deacetylase [Granulicella sp. WH15]
MCVVAHPDDECYAFGGALALAASQGVETYVVCLTDGQAATNRGCSSSCEELGRMRREEFANSCKVLGVARHELLDYQDAQLEFAEFSVAAGRIVERIREFRPDVVVTFGADGGMNTHPDHTMVSAITTAAYHWAASAKRFHEAGPTHHASRLFHVTTNFFMEERAAPMPAPWTLTLDISSVLALKQEAFAQHVSQAPLMEKTRHIFEKHGDTEVYTLMATCDLRAAQFSTDMFDGL